MKVRSPLGYRSSYNLSVENQIPETPTISTPNVKPKPHPPVTRQVHVVPPEKEKHQVSHSNENLRKPSILSLRSLSLSLRMIMPIKFQRDDDHSELKTIDETKTLNETEFQKFPPHAYGISKSRKFTIFKNQKIYARRSSMSDIPDDPTSCSQKNLHMQNASGPSGSTSNIKHDHHHHHQKKQEHKNQKSHDKDALKEVRRRNIESAKRLQTAPRRISTAY